MPRLLLPVALCIALGLALGPTLGCSVLTPAGAAVRESSGLGIEACEYIGEFVGRGTAPHDARIDALNAAGTAGATVVVWDEVGAPTWPTRGTYVSAKGYRCP